MIPIKRLSVSEAKDRLMELDLLIRDLWEEGLLEDPLERYMEAVRRFKTGIIHGVMEEAFYMFELPDGSVNYVVNAEVADHDNSLG